MFNLIQKFLAQEEMRFWMIAALIFSIAAAGSSFAEGASISIAGMELNKIYSAIVTAFLVFVSVSSVPVIGYMLNRKLSRKLDLD